MDIYKVRTVSKGYAVGRIFFMEGNKEEERAESGKTDDYVRELLKLENALVICEREISLLCDSAASRKDVQGANIFVSHLMMLKDDDLIAEIKRNIREKKENAAYSVKLAIELFSSRLEKSDDEYIRERASDVREVGRRLVGILLGIKSESVIPKGSILAASEITPAAAAELDKESVAALITERGSETSHSSVMARGLGIPAAVGLSIKEDMNGKMAAFDSDLGELYVDPTPDVIGRTEKKKAEYEKRLHILEKMKDAEDITPDRRRIELLANVGSIKEAKLAMSCGAKGIGLFRSEFVFMEGEAPSEDRQTEIYSELVRIADRKKVIIRTLDAGSDKIIAGISLRNEENPALGMRGIRLSLGERELFRCQLKAILRAAALGEIWIMFPMISCAREMESALECVADARKELEREGKSYGSAKLGMMVETPAAALCIDDFLEMSDFFSIGTNDLAQYTLAADRAGNVLSGYKADDYRSVMMLIEAVIKRARLSSKWVGICGELGSDPGLIRRFIDMGVNELSVSPSMILPTRAIIREEKI